MKRAVYAGSFDPITNGHLWMIQEGGKLFDKLVVSVGVNASKKYSFSLKQRIEILNDTVGHLPAITIRNFKNKFMQDISFGESEMLMTIVTREGSGLSIAISMWTFQLFF